MYHCNRAACHVKLEQWAEAAQARVRAAWLGGRGGSRRVAAVVILLGSAGSRMPWGMPALGCLKLPCTA